MLLLKLSDQTYPYTLSELRRDYPNVSFPSDLAGIDPSDFGAAEVVTDDPPGYNPNTQAIVPNPPQLIDGEYRVTWTVRSLTTEEIKSRLPINWRGFKQSMMLDTAFNTLLGDVFAVNPSVAIQMPIALAQIDSNAVDSFALVFDAFCQIGQVSSEQREDWAILAESFNLPSEFVEVILGI